MTATVIEGNVTHMPDPASDDAVIGGAVWLLDRTRNSDSGSNVIVHYNGLPPPDIDHVREGIFETMIIEHVSHQHLSLSLKRENNHMMSSF